MGLFSSSSKSTAVSTTNVDEKNFNLQDTNAPSVLATGSDAQTTVNITDQGAVQAAADISSDAFSAFNESIDRVFEFAGNLAGDVFDFSGGAIAGAQQAAVEQAGDALTAANQISRSDTADTLNTLTKWLAGAAAVSVVAWAYFRGRK